MSFESSLNTVSGLTRSSASSSLLSLSLPESTGLAVSTPGVVDGTLLGSGSQFLTKPMSDSSTDGSWSVGLLIESLGETE